MSLSVGLSKSGALAKASTPASVTLNLAASAPPFFDQVRSSFSASVAVSVVTAVVFSATDCGEVVVITGAVLVAEDVLPRPEGDQSLGDSPLRAFTCTW